jgi:hypothetical protein
MHNKLIKSTVSNSIKNSYKNVLYSPRFLRKIFNYKIKHIEKFKNKDFVIEKIFNKKRDSKKSFFLKKKNLTLEILNNLYFKKKLTKKEIKIILKFYKKFSVYLKLKKFYSDKLMLKSKKETHLYSYIFLAALVEKVKDINKIQKLNFLLKINEKIIINIKNITSKELYYLFCKNLKNEIKLIKNYI